MNPKTKQIVLPLITALIWGSAFVAQKSGAEVLGAFTFTWTRYSLAAIALVCFLALRGRRTGRKPFSENRPALLRGALVMGTLLAVASNLQQYGMGMTTAGKAGFITALYIVLVPLFGLFFGKRVRAAVWCGVAVALAGLYLLSFAAGGETAFTGGDVYMLLCAVVFSFHILATDRFTKLADAVELACLQFTVAAAESLLCALVTEGVPLDAIASAAFPIFYAGVISGGIAYTLQNVAQSRTSASVAAIVLSTESVFGALSGWIVLHDVLSAGQFCGCALVFVAVVATQLLAARKTASAG